MISLVPVRVSRRKSRPSCESRMSRMEGLVGKGTTLLRKLAAGMLASLRMVGVEHVGDVKVASHTEKVPA